MSRARMMRRALRAALPKKGATVRLHHGSDMPWIMRGQRPYLDAGEGLGLHAGTKAQAKDRLGVPSVKIGPFQVHAPTMGRGYVDGVRFKSAREIVTPDMIDWRPQAWLEILEDGGVQGISEAERRSLVEAIRPLLSHDDVWTDPRTLVRQILLDHGIKRIRYRNMKEGTGQDSIIALDPSIIATDSVYGRSARALAAAGTVAAAAPGEAAAPEPRTNNAEPVSSVRRRS